MKKILTLIILLNISLQLFAQALTSDKSVSFVIQLASVDKLITENKIYDKLKHYGIIYNEQLASGVYKVYLKNAQGQNFGTRKEAENILKSVKKLKGFKKAFITEKPNQISPFVQPSMQFKEKELIISFKLNEPNAVIGSKSVPEPQSAIVIPVPVGNYYAIQLTALKDPKKDKSFVAGLFILDNTEFKSLDTRIEGSFKVYYLGRFLQQKEAEEKLKAFILRKNCDECTKQKLRVVLFEKQKDAGHRPVK